MSVWYAKCEKWSYDIASTFHEKGLFFHEFLKRPAMVGSICPSGEALTRRLLLGLSAEESGLVIDLGAGSGPVSEGIARLGIQKDRIIAIEAIGGFKESFSQKCPDIPFITGDARNLKAILDREVPGRKISAIISSLPFRAMGPALTGEILDEIHLVLQERGGRFVQYTYAWWLRYPLQGNGFAPETAGIVWKNMPPARVELYQAVSDEKTLPEYAVEKHRVWATIPGKAVRASLTGIGVLFRGLELVEKCWTVVERVFHREARKQFFGK